MFNFEICFTHPWLLLLLIPALATTLIPYFRVKKRYRRTRNRVISVVLHSLVMTLCIVLLSGFYIRYYVPNEQNEIILLVDVSDTENEAKESRDLFIQNVLSESGDDGFNIGIVTFGFDQVYAVPLTQDIDSIFNVYAAAELPDTTATNIADALEYAVSLFNYPDTGKIVLVTDAKETDGELLSVISSATAKGIAIDAAYVPSTYAGTDAQIIGVSMPEQHVGLAEEHSIVVNIKSNVAGAAQLTLYDNDEQKISGIQDVELVEGEQSFILANTFDVEGLHELRFQLKMSDSIVQNNEYTTYYDLQIYNKLLIIESKAGKSTALVSMLNGAEEKYSVSVVDVASDAMPTTLDALRMYDQVILNDVANSDLPIGFDVMLQSYVKDYGGGLFTAGGSDEHGKAHSYNKLDMYGSIYQEMLPVQVFNYTPPIGVMLVVDSSGSMLSNNEYGGSIFDSAKAGALACLDVLYERDYVGLMTLATNQEIILPLTPRTQETKIRETISGLKADGGNTVFGDAINRAGLELRNRKDVAKRHIIVISDGMTEAPETYEPLIKDFYDKDGTTFSVIGINMEDSARTAMTNATNIGHGRLYDITISRNMTKDIIDSVKGDLNVPKIEDVNQEEFAPLVSDSRSPLVRDLKRDVVDRDRLTMKIGGFYGAKMKEGADLILEGDYAVPIYAQWKYGAGMVGSFMCDLQGTAWSKAFMDSDDGKTFMTRVVDNLMPVSNIRPNDISISLKEDNYTNTMSVFAKLQEGESVKGELVKVTQGGETVVSLNEVTEGIASSSTFYTVSALTATNKYSRCEFVIKESGVYIIRLTKFDKDGKQIGDPLIVHKEFSYSEEYDQAALASKAEQKELLTTLVEKGEGKLMEDLIEVEPVFEGFVIKVEKIFDPRLSFMIAAIVLFLLDVAVRKFKFKWIHEIIRDRKRKKELQ